MVMEIWEELVGDEPLDIEVDLVLDGKVFSTLHSSKAIFDAAPERGDFRSQQFIFAIKVRDLPRDSHLSFRLRPQSAPARKAGPMYCSPLIL
ncbi:unnamed protein product [Symbiodinium pilosum]|uniref:Uncharacterized protein n=1 Tax=Symbiodinium pilosum TaxID=2952 RepID=A0A812UI05_SYMPI|nr:unnamed protein product [Symbiodinium pilosum]